jgi:type IV pilus assembly protein PilC
MTLNAYHLFVVWLFLSIPIGYVVVWMANLWLPAGNRPAGRVSFLIRTLAWSVVVSCVLSLLVTSVAAVSIVGGLALLLVVLMGLARRRMLERRSLLWYLSTAVSQGIPLEQAARAYADERADLIGYRVRRMAEYLEVGTPLPAALAAAGTPLPTDAALALHVGLETSTLPTAMQQIARAETDLDVVLRSILEKLFYLCVIAYVLIGVVVFLMLKIVPVFQKMFEEFDLRLPAMTQAVIEVSRVAVSYWFLGSPFFLVAFIIVGLGVLYYIGWLPRDFPVVNRLTARHDAALVLRSLGHAVRQRIPLERMIGLLAQVYPRSSVRLRMSAAEARMQGGTGWCESLRDARLLQPYDFAVLQSAERAGNLAWALDEMADSTVRRIVYRLRLWLNILFPVVLLVFGVVVAFHVIGLFLPLVSLIQGLS